jgi:hypothetical protein
MASAFLRGRWRSNVWTYPGASSLGSDSRRGLKDHPTKKELRRACRGMVRHGGGVFERPAVLQIGRDSGRPERVIADFGGDVGRRGAAADHGIGIGLRQGRRRQRIRAAADSPKQRPVWIGHESAAVDVGVKVGFKIVVACSSTIDGAIA